jgi:hypothetical protein
VHRKGDADAVDAATREHPSEEIGPIWRGHARGGAERVEAAREQQLAAPPKRRG